MSTLDCTEWHSQIDAGAGANHISLFATWLGLNNLLDPAHVDPQSLLELRAHKISPREFLKSLHDSLDTEDLRSHQEQITSYYKERYLADHARAFQGSSLSNSLRLLQNDTSAASESGGVYLAPADWPHYNQLGPALDRALGGEIFSEQDQSQLEANKYKSRAAAYFRYRPEWSMGATINIPTGQVFVYDRAKAWYKDASEYTLAQLEAEQNGIGVSKKLVCLLTLPVDTGTLKLSYYSKPPEIKLHDWAQVSEFTLWAPSGKLVIEAGDKLMFTLHQRGVFRARWQTDGEYYQLQLWRQWKKLAPVRKK